MDMVGGGIVYMAEDLKIGRIVAIKQFFKEMGSSAAFRDEFMREARLAGMLGHPNIVSIYNVEGSSDSEFCIIMEYLGGGNLQNLLDNTGRLDTCQALMILAGVLSGLDAAHHMTIIHSDIKPSNILFAVGGFPKINDFGMARSYSKVVEKSLMEESGGAARGGGTPLYMSPEQASGADYDCRSDIYSAGAVLYKMLSGEELFQFSIDTERLKRNTVKALVCSAKPKPLASFRGDVPDFIERIMLKMLAKDPEARYQNSRDALKETLKAIVKLKDLCPSAAEMLFETPCRISTSPAAILEDIVSLLLVDGSISAPERVELSKRAERLGIGSSMLSGIENGVRTKLGLDSR